MDTGIVFVIGTETWVPGSLMIFSGAGFGHETSPFGFAKAANGSLRNK
jgi:hypothetical protein